MYGLVGREGALHDALDRRQLEVRGSGQSHVIKLGAHLVRQLRPDQPPVRARLVAELINVAALLDGARQVVAVSLLANDGDVPLCYQSENFTRRRQESSLTSSRSLGKPGLGPRAYWWRHALAKGGWP